MEPVVNGIEENFSGDIEILRLDANQNIGKDAFSYYRFQGHPAFILLNPEGKVLWSGLGVQNAGDIEIIIQDALGNPN